MGLSETKLLFSTSRYTLKNNKEFKTFFNNDSPTPRGSGVGIIISNEYAKYIYKVIGYKGREIYNYITTNIKEALRKKSRVILMGDFNINYEQYIRTYNRNGYTHWRDMFF